MIMLVLTSTSGDDLCLVTLREILDSSDLADGRHSSVDTKTVTLTVVKLSSVSTQSEKT